MNDKPQLTSKHVEALQWYARENGRCWKEKLNLDWERGYAHGEYTAALRQVRNNFGPSWLQKYRLPKPETV